jgi:hypothetical protein
MKKRKSSFVINQMQGKGVQGKGGKEKVSATVL